MSSRDGLFMMLITYLPQEVMFAPLFVCRQDISKSIGPILNLVENWVTFFMKICL